MQHIGHRSGLIDGNDPVCNTCRGGRQGGDDILRPTDLGKIFEHNDTPFPSGRASFQDPFLRIERIALRRADQAARNLGGGPLQQTLDLAAGPVPGPAWFAGIPKGEKPMGPGPAGAPRFPAFRISGRTRALQCPRSTSSWKAERMKYAIRLPANQVLQHRIGYLLKRPVGRPPNEVRRFHANFTYQAGSWTKPRRVIAKVEWHPGELYPRVGFIVTNLSRPADRVVAFYNKRGTCEQWIKEGKGAIKWTRLSCRTLAANAVRLQLHALAYNLGNFLRTLATPEPIKDWSLTSLKEKLIKIGAKVVSHGRYVAFQMAEVAIPRQMFQEILRLIAELRPQPPPAPA